MNVKIPPYWLLSLLSFLGTWLIWFATAAPSQAHWADMAAAEIVVNSNDVAITLTFPTGLTAFADSDRSNQLSATEVQTHQAELTTFLGEAIRLTNSSNQLASLTVTPIAKATLPPNVQIAPNTHSTVLLTYSWQQPIQGLKIHYNLFLPSVATASCLATILQNQQLQTFVFTPTRQSFALTPGLMNSGLGGVWLAIAGAVVWGAMHSLAPGHGKTLVAAYLVGSRATPKHAVFLAITTTVTHTVGIFALGLITLFASQYILPEQLYPWLNLFSGLMVVAIGFHLLWSRFQSRQTKQADHHESHHHHHKSHLHDHKNHHHDDHANHRHHEIYHHHDHGMHHHYEHLSHSHLPTTDHASITWRSLLALGISGGLVPCPAALVLLLSAIALGQTSLGLVLVLAFSLGLASVLTGLGLMMVYAKHLFDRLPTAKISLKLLPILSPTCILFIGLGLSTQALVQMIG